MEAGTMNMQDLLTGYVEDLNEATKSREFEPFVQKWFDVPRCSWTLNHEVTGIADAKNFWTHFLPVGQPVPREVLQFPYKVEDGRVYTWRMLQGGVAKKPSYGLQETQFDDKTLISEIVISSTPEKPEVDEDPQAAKSRLGRILLAFADAFNDYFKEGDESIFDEWCAPDVHMVLDTTVWGMGVVGPHHRIAQSANFTLGEWQDLGDGHLKVRLDYTDWGGKDGFNDFDMTVTPEGKIRELVATLELE
jgi:hypothetical protein